jgi:hypothetical protein
MLDFQVDGQESLFFSISQHSPSAFHGCFLRQCLQIGALLYFFCFLSKKLVGLKAVWRAQTGDGRNVLSWAKQLVIRLLDVTHGQWIYRNIQVHDETQGTLRMREKELLQQEIEVEMELGFECFLAMHCSLANVTLEDLEAGDGEQQEY